MNLKSILLKLFLLLLTFTFSNIEAQSLLKTQGKAIVNVEGDTVLLRGMGLGGWMLQEGYMLQTAGFANAQYQIRNEIEELIGAESTQDFYDAWLANHVTRKDIDALADWGFNSVRLPMHYNLYTLPIEDEPVFGQQTWLEKGFELTDSLISWCKANNMYIVLDLHAAPGGQGNDQGISDYDPTKPNLWESEENQTKTVELWKRIAERYVDEPVIAGYDLINETNFPMEGNIPLRDLFYRLTDSIRTVDTNHIIFIEGNWFANDFTNLTPPWDDNLVYAPHKYWSINDQASIQWVLDIQYIHNVPLYFGECGENSNVWFKDAIQLFEDRGIGWAWWPMKKIESISGPLSIKKSDEYQQLLDYWNNGGTTPSADFAKSTLMQLTEDLKIENCFFQKDVIDAMFRQVKEGGVKAYNTFDIPGVVYASDFDMGTQNEAYFDLDIANYQVSTGNFTAWNRGWTYRNDGVDIEKSEDNINANGYNVGFVAKDEWIQYDVNVTEDALYDLKVRIASESSDGKFHFNSGSAAITSVVSAPNTSGWQTWESIIIPNVIMSADDKKVRLYIDQGEFNIGSFEFIKKGASTLLTTNFLSAETLDDHTVQLNINKSLDPGTANDLSDFSISVNGSNGSITNAVLDENNPRILYFILDGVFRSEDEIRISYDGNQVQAFDGSSLASFSQQMVKNNVAIIHALPGRIEMEDYFFQSGIQLETTSDAGGGQNIGFLDEGDYLDYYINVPQSGIYSVDYRTAALSEIGEIRLQLIEPSGEIITLQTQDFPSTGGWQTWATTSGPDISFSAGEHQMRVVISKPLFNMNWMEFGLLSSTKDPSYSKILNVFPNPGIGQFGLELDSSIKKGEVIIYNAMGNRIYSQPFLNNNGYRIDINLQNVPVGYYLFNIYTDGKFYGSKKVLKM